MLKKTERLELFNTIPLDFISQKNFIEKVISWVLQKEKRKVFYLNAHNIVTCFNNSSFLSIIKSADLIYPDGWGPIFWARMSGKNYKERVNAADFIHKFLKILSLKKAKMYLLGGDKETLIQTIKTIHDKYEGITISGYHHGFFKKDEERIIVKEIKSTKPNLVLIGMGTPKQELWVYKNWAFLPQAVYWCVGGLFGYISEIKSRAPYWMRKFSLEWLYRLCQEPRRLGIRYTVENFLFIYYLLKFKIKKAKFII